MIYLIGGAPRAGKSTFCRRISTKLKTGWISPDLIQEILIDRIGDFDSRLREADAVLTADPFSDREPFKQ